jgi:hypothetical protein
VFIALQHDGDIHIFNLKNDDNFPDEFKVYIESIESHLEIFFNETTPVHRVFDLHKVINDANPHHFAVINMITKDRRCPKILDLTHAKTKIMELNAILQKRCPAFYLNLDYTTAFPENSHASMYYEIYVNAYICPKLILCLFTEVNKIKKCVSSITLNRQSDDEMSISSRTDVSYEGRKFNILLRSVAIMILKHIMHTAETLVSNAENVISAYIMLKWFNAMNIHGMNQRVRMPHDDDLFNTLTRYFETHQKMETQVELNKHNIENAEIIFHKTVARMNCEPLSGGKYRVKPRKLKNTRKLKKNKPQKYIIKNEVEL